MRNSLLTLATLLAAVSAPALAGSIPYATPGQLAPDTTFTATSTGNIVGYFAGSSAGDNDSIELWDVTTNTYSGFLFPNHSSQTKHSYSLFCLVLVEYKEQHLIDR